MASVCALTVQPLKMRTTQGFHQYQHQRRRSSVTVIRDMPRKKQSLVPVMRLFGPAIFEASKLKVLFVGVGGQKHPWKLPRIYTLTHSDVISILTLAISETINNSQLQGWYNKLQRNEVEAEWKKVKGKVSLHIHCHISGGQFLQDLIAKFRHYIFCKELPVVSAEGFCPWRPLFVQQLPGTTGCNGVGLLPLKPQNTAKSSAGVPFVMQQAQLIGLSTSPGLKRIKRTFSYHVTSICQSNASKSADVAFLR
ncbi:STAY-GREEN 1, chloroplastic-like protein [Drosera capensis]